MEKLYQTVVVLVRREERRPQSLDCLENIVHYDSIKNAEEGILTNILYTQPHELHIHNTRSDKFKDMGMTIWLEVY